MKDINEMTTREILEKRRAVVETLKERTPHNSDFNIGAQSVYREELAFLDSVLSALNN